MEIRTPAGDDEHREILRMVRAALLSGPSDHKGFAAFMVGAGDRDSLAMFDDGRPVGHVAAYRLDTTVPGGRRVATAGVTGVGVLPTHTRRGILTRLMEQLLRGARTRGQPLASLRASEAPIYGRFGFGLAGDQVAIVVHRDGARPFRVPPAAGSMHLLVGNEPIEVVPALYDRVARLRVGTINRFDWHWPHLLEDVNKESASMGDPGTFVAVHRDADGGEDGYVEYTVTWADRFGENYLRGEGKILDLWGLDAAVERSLWEYLLDLDLVVTWRATIRPPADPIRRTFHDHRVYNTIQRLDEQWVRLLDVETALAARTYGRSAAAVTICVHDPLFGGNCGTWTISPDGARRGDGEPDLTIDVTALGAAYLGGTSWFDLAGSGEIGSVTEGALSALDALFQVRPIPFCGTDF
jgi:predicted acetyltransferase